MIAAHTLEIMAPLVALAAASPGPDVIYITSNALSGKWKNGFAAWSGICFGVFIYVLATAFGLAALFALLPSLYYVIKWLGVCYLAYLGFSFLKSAITSQQALKFSASEEKVPPLKLFFKGLVVTLLNPKAAMFFTAFLPQFVDPTIGAVSTQLFLLGIFAMVVAQPIYIFYMVSCVAIGNRFQKKKNYTGNLTLLRWLDGICGALYMSFAAGLAFWKRA